MKRNYPLHLEACMKLPHIILMIALGFFIFQPKETQAEMDNPAIRGLGVGASTLGIMSMGALTGGAIGFVTSGEGGFEGLYNGLIGATAGAGISAPLSIMLLSKPAVFKNTSLCATL